MVSVYFRYSLPLPPPPGIFVLPEQCQTSLTMIMGSVLPRYHALRAGEGLNWGGVAVLLRFRTVGWDIVGLRDCGLSK